MCARAGRHGELEKAGASVLCASGRATVRMAHLTVYANGVVKRTWGGKTVGVKTRAFLSKFHNFFYFKNK